jgi:pimeloyl-ACP methyl ester carboxylesterase
MNVVLVHGWGHDAGIWDAVRAQLDPTLAVTTLDFGYFASPTAVPAEPTFTEPVLAVGHSLGALWWLAQSQIPWRRLLCLDGFPRFTETDGYPGVAPRVLARMQKQLERDPAAVLTDFHARCGTACPAGAPDVTRLAAGLAQLAELDGRATLAARTADVWAVSGDGDPIVPPAMSAAAFAALPAGHHEIVAVPGHRLPQSRPELCAQWIARLCEGRGT